MAQFQCKYCQESIQDVRVKCTECPGDFELCLQCFSMGAENGQHKRNHSYQLIDNGSFPVFTPPYAWKAKEELSLLDAVEQYGFGNWEDVASQIKTRNQDESRQKYCDIYIAGNVGKLTWPSEAPSRPIDHTIGDVGPLSPTHNAALNPVELATEEQQQLGYLPLRDDFEREFENESEVGVSNLVVKSDDEDVDIALKLALTDIYRKKLRERIRRKRIVRDYGLVVQFFNSCKKDKEKNNKAKKLSREEKEFQERTKSFTQFHSSQEHQQLFESLRKEKELKSRIKELTRYRRNGITKMTECNEFDNLRYKRERKKENKNSKKSFGFLPGEQWVIPPKVLNGVKKRRKKRRRFTPKRSKLRHK